MADEPHWAHYVYGFDVWKIVALLATMCYRLEVKLALVKILVFYIFSQTMFYTYHTKDS